MDHEFDNDYRDPTGPLFKAADFPSPQGEPQRGRLAIVDDHGFMVRIFMEYFSKVGYPGTGYMVNGGRLANALQIRSMAEVIAQKGPDVAVVDKGLGRMSGIELILALKEHGIPTIMLTGEPGTRETHRVADLYLEKPVMRTEILLNAIESLMGSK